MWLCSVSNFVSHSTICSVAWSTEESLSGWTTQPVKQPSSSCKKSPAKRAGFPKILMNSRWEPRHPGLRREHTHEKKEKKRIESRWGREVTKENWTQWKMILCTKPMKWKGGFSSIVEMFIYDWETELRKKRVCTDLYEWILVVSISMAQWWTLLTVVYLCSYCAASQHHRKGMLAHKLW